MGRKKLIIGTIILVIVIFALLTIEYRAYVTTEETTYCEEDDDCVFSGYLYICCSGCVTQVMNRDAHEKRKESRKFHCLFSVPICPNVNCELVEEKAICENNKCVRAVLE